MPPESLLSQARSLLENVRIGECRNLAKEQDTRSVQNAEFHRQWADVLEQLELFDELITELNLAIRDDPDTPETYRRLAEVCSDNGYADRAVRTLVLNWSSN